MKLLMKLISLPSLLLITGSIVLTIGIICKMDALMIIGSIWGAAGIIISECGGK